MIARKIAPMIAAPMTGSRTARRSIRSTDADGLDIGGVYARSMLSAAQPHTRAEDDRVHIQTGVAACCPAVGDVREPIAKAQRHPRLGKKCGPLVRAASPCSGATSPRALC